MMKPKKNKSRHLFYSLLYALILTLLAPQTLAYHVRTGISPLNRAIELISNLFNIEVLRSNTYVQEGFLKLMLFIVIFAVANMSLKKTKVFDNKTAGIISFAFSMIGVFLMPTTWLLATGGLITVIISSVVFLGFFLGLTYVAVFVLRKNWLQNLLGLLLLLLLLFLLDDFASFVGLPLIILVKENWINKILRIKN
ncbi:MAG TPA: hypothetical protein ENI59_01600 [Euryarchaeota archaeon]|nr:hypothetical protein [Euryarchaeota archaeon]